MLCRIENVQRVIGDFCFFIVQYTLFVVVVRYGCECFGFVYLIAYFDYLISEQGPKSERNERKEYNVRTNHTQIDERVCAYAIQNTYSWWLNHSIAPTHSSENSDIGRREQKKIKININSIRVANDTAKQWKRENYRK